ncbi:hypothetical protein D3C73_1481060 [compost metagenome]
MSPRLRNWMALRPEFWTLPATVLSLRVEVAAGRSASISLSSVVPDSCRSSALTPTTGVGVSKVERRMRLPVTTMSPTVEASDERAVSRNVSACA